MVKGPRESDFDDDAPLRAPLDGLGTNAAPPQGHDDFILRAARETSQSIRKRSLRSGWRMPLSMAASFVLGVGVALIYMSAGTSSRQQLSGLMMPATQEIRGAPHSQTVPVEQVPADVWYRYIQELVYSGDSQLAARHLQRFVELHPDYVQQP